MRVLFVMRHHGYVRNFESSLELLAERGHEVVLAFEQTIDTALGRPTIECTRRLVERCPNITATTMPAPPDDRWQRLRMGLRHGLDWLRYLEPALADAHKARARTRRRAPALIQRLAAVATRAPGGLGLLTRTLRYLERSLPVASEHCAQIAGRQPDLVLVTPLLGAGAQADHLRAARRLGLRTGLCVSSWDNLTSKGLIHEAPDVVTLWNEHQAREARELHRIDPERIAITGAQAYDHWFSWRPSRDREAFCRACGLDPDRPYVVYMCSSSFIAGDEAGHVEAWVQRLRAHEDPELRDVGVLVRPHPANAGPWHERDLSHLGNVALWSANGTEPTDQATRDAFFDTVHHSAAVVGLNSSAMIEAAVMGRPVLTVLTPEYEASQEGTLHFRLIAGEDGMLVVARSWEEHAEQVLAALRDPDYARERRERFLGSFVRPRGLDVPARSVLVDELERAGRAPAPAPVRLTPGQRLARAALLPLTAWPEPGEKSRRRRVKARRRALRRVRRRVVRLPGRLLTAVVSARSAR